MKLGTESLQVACVYTLAAPVGVCDYKKWIKWPCFVFINAPNYLEKLVLCLLSKLFCTYCLPCKINGCVACCLFHYLNADALPLLDLNLYATQHFHLIDRMDIPLLRLYYISVDACAYSLAHLETCVCLYLLKWGWTSLPWSLIVGVGDG
jgi:hypothetical protein